MGVIRAILVTITSILLFLTLFSMNAFLTMSMSLEYDTVHAEFADIVGNLVIDNIDLSILDENLPAVAVYCQNRDKILLGLSLEDIASLKDENISLEEIIITEPTTNKSFFDFSIACDAITLGSEEIIRQVIADKVNESYYIEEDCEFWDCSSSSGVPLYLISQKAQEYWEGWFYLSLFASLILAGVLFLFVGEKKGLPFLLSGLVFIAALPFLGMGWLLTLLSDWQFANFFIIFFTKASTVFIINLIIAAVLIGIGLTIKFVGVGQKIGGWFNKDKKPEVKEVGVVERIVEKPSKPAEKPVEKSSVSKETSKKPSSSK